MRTNLGKVAVIAVSLPNCHGLVVDRIVAVSLLMLNVGNAPVQEIVNVVVV